MNRLKLGTFLKDSPAEGQVLSRKKHFSEFIAICKCPVPDFLNLVFQPDTLNIFAGKKRLFRYMEGEAYGWTHCAQRDDQ